MASFSYKKRYNYWLSESEAKAAEEEEKGRERVSFNLGDLAEAVIETVKDATGQDKPFDNPTTGIPYSVAHAQPTALASPDEDYDKIRARTAADGEKDALIKIHAALINPDEPDKKESYELPHHNYGRGDFKCVKAGVIKCARQLGIKMTPDGTIPTAHPLAQYGNKIAKEHIIQHLKEFEAQAQAQKEE